MNHFSAKGIVLTRTEYSEADRIITFLTDSHGKVHAIAKGVRKPKSKLAGGIELFSVSELHFIEGKSSLDTLSSSRLEQHYGNIVHDLERTNAGYEILRILQISTEDSCEPDYFELAREALNDLNNLKISPDLVRGRFYMQLLVLTGHQPDLTADVNNEQLVQDASYAYDYESGRLRKNGQGGLGSNEIKVLRLMQGKTAGQLNKISGIEQIAARLRQPLKQMTEYYLH